MKRIVVLATLATLAVGCTPEEEARLLDVEYRGWRQSTNATLNFPVPGHGSGLRRVFVDDTGFETDIAEDGSITYPAGTIFIKEIYAEPDPPEDAEPVSLAGMVKAPDDPRSRGGWIWISRNPESGAETILQEEFCVTCHANANETHPYGAGNSMERFRDYIFHAPALEARGAAAAAQ